MEVRSSISTVVDIEPSQLNSLTCRGSRCTFDAASSCVASRRERPAVRSSVPRDVACACADLFHEGVKLSMPGVAKQPADVVGLKCVTKTSEIIQRDCLFIQASVRSPQLELELRDRSAGTFGPGDHDEPLHRSRR